MTLLQKARHKTIIKEAKNLFLERGIDAVTITDLATHLSIGEASLYRYFGKKQTLMIEAGIMIWEEVYETLEKRSPKATGYENVKYFYEFFLEFFQNKPEFFRLLDEFDLKIIQSGISHEELKDYEQIVLKFKNVFDKFFEMGKADKTIKEGIDQDIFYYTTNHALISLCKKLATQSHLLRYESHMQETTQIECLIEIFLHYLH